MLDDLLAYDGAPPRSELPRVVKTWSAVKEEWRLVEVSPHDKRSRAFVLEKSEPNAMGEPAWRAMRRIDGDSRGQDHAFLMALGMAS